MSSLLSALRNQVPLIWVKTIEPERLVSKLPVWVPERDIYQFDARSGLMLWDRDKKKWIVVLLEQPINMDGDTAELPIKRPDVAFDYVLNQENVLYLMRNAHIGIENYYNYFSSVFSEYRQAVWTDDADKLPIQFICISPQDEIPNEIRAMTTSCVFSLPNDTEIASILDLFVKSQSERIIENQSTEKIVLASKGLSELEILELFLQSMRDNEGLINDEYVNDVKLARWKAAGILNIIKPNHTFVSVGGLDRAKELIERAVWIRDNPQDAAEYGVTPLRRFLFLGPPGTGKSLICEAASSMLKLDLARVSVAQAMNKFIGQSEQNMRDTFAQIRAVAPITMWIDELGRDLSGGGSSDVVDGGTTSRVHATLLTEIQELPENVFLFAAANNIEALAPEMLRAGRFDKILFVGFPAFSERIDIFNIYLSGDSEFDYERLAQDTASFTGAEIETLVSFTRNEISAVQRRKINTQDILDMIPQQKNRIWLRHKSQMAGMYRIAMNEHAFASTAQADEASYYAKGEIPVRLAHGAMAPAVRRPTAFIK